MMRRRAGRNKKRLGSRRKERDKEEGKKKG